MRKMKRFFMFTVLLSILLVGCDGNGKEDVSIRTERYLNTSNTVVISSYNGYKLIKSEMMKDDEDGGIVVVLKFSKPIVQSSLSNSNK